MAQFESVDVNGCPMRICMAIPAAPAPKCVILMCHITGLDEFTAVSADSLAGAGFLVAAPDVFHYTEWVEEREARRATLRDERILDDKEPAPADVDRIEAELESHSIPCSFHRYEGAGHAFQNFSSPERYREEASEDAWTRLLDFLGKAF